MVRHPQRFRREYRLRGGPHLFAVYAVWTDPGTGRRVSWPLSPRRDLRGARIWARRAKVVYNRQPVNPCRVKIVRCKKWAVT